MALNDLCVLVIHSTVLLSLTLNPTRGIQSEREVQTVKCHHQVSFPYAKRIVPTKGKQSEREVPTVKCHRQVSFPETRRIVQETQGSIKK